MGRLFCILLCTFFLIGAAPVKKRPRTVAAPPTLANRLQLMLDSNGASRAAHWGVYAVELATGKTLLAHNATRLFVPASNTKLFSTALAFDRLGPAYRFQTKIVSDMLPDKDGRIIGDLRLIGGGDPTMSARSYPYQAVSKNPIKSAPNSPYGPLEELAAQLIEKGVREIKGDIVGDDSRYPWDPFPDGWAVDDPLYEYGTPVSALIWNDNAFRLSLEAASEIGVAPQLTLFPNVAYFNVQNLVTTEEGRDSKINLRRVSLANELVVTGQLGNRAKVFTELLGVDDPALFAASALRESLEKLGVKISGNARAMHRMAGESRQTGGQILAERISPVLTEVATVVNKVSQNLHAEILLREVALVKRGEGTRQLGQLEMTDFLAQVGAAKNGFHFEDGSGLSRLTLLTPETAVKLLTYMHKSKNREAYTRTLPIGGEDGTLDTRFRGAASAARVHAKTGSLSHVSALSGYADSPIHGRIAFSILVNNFNSPTTEIRTVIDKIVLALAE